MDDTMRRNLDIFLRNSEPRAQEQLVQALREVQAALQGRNSDNALPALQEYYGAQKEQAGRMISRYVQDWVHKIPIDTIASQLGEVADNFSGGNEIDEAADPQLCEEPAEASNDSQPAGVASNQDTVIKGSPMAVSTKREMTEAPANPPVPEDLLQRVEETIDWEDVLEIHSDTYQGHIPDYETAMRLKTEYMARGDFQGSAEAIADFPRDVEGQRLLVGEIYHAMRDTTTAIDAPRLKKALPKGRGAQGGKNKTASTVPNHQMDRALGLSCYEAEILAWDILYAVRDAQYGIVHVAPWSQDFHFDRSFPTFRSRMDMVLRSIRESKAIVSSFLNSNLLRRVVAHPLKELKRKSSNKAQNADRDLQVKVGNNAIKRGFVNVDDEGVVKDLEGNLIQSTREQPGAMVEHLAKLQNRGKRMRFGEKSTITVAQPSTSATATARQPTPSATSSSVALQNATPAPTVVATPSTASSTAGTQRPPTSSMVPNMANAVQQQQQRQPQQQPKQQPRQQQWVSGAPQMSTVGTTATAPSTIAQSALPIQLGIPMFGTPPTGSIQGNTFNNLPGHAQQGATTQQLSISEAQSRFHQAQARRSQAQTSNPFGGYNTSNASATTSSFGQFPGPQASNSLGYMPQSINPAMMMTPQTMNGYATSQGQTSGRGIAYGPMAPPMTSSAQGLTNPPAQFSSASGTTMGTAGTSYFDNAAMAGLSMPMANSTSGDGVNQPSNGAFNFGADSCADQFGGIDINTLDLDLDLEL